MTCLDKWPLVETFMGMNLQIGAIVIATVSIVHPLAFGSTLCVPFSYIFLTIWILVIVFFATSIVLVFGIVNKDPNLCMVWIWYTLFFVIMMFLLLTILLFVYASRRQRGRVLMVLIGMLYYGAMLYFVFVINSYRYKHLV